MANYIKSTAIQDNSISESKLDSSLQSWKETITNHINNTSNPHNITKSSIGLDNVTNDAQVKRSELGVANGVATLDSTGKIPSGQLPSYVDDVIEGYLYNGVFYKDTSYTTSIVGESGKIYIDLPTNKTYRWTGSVYGVISETIALGETPSTAYRGDRGKIAYDHSQSAHAPSNAQANVIETIKVNGTALTPNSKAVDITIPTVGNGTITIKQGGTSKGTFTTNQSGNTTIELTDNNTTYTASNGISLSGTTFSNSGVRSIATGTTNGTISVNTNGNISNIGVYGLKSAAYTNSSDYAAASHTHSYIPLSDKGFSNGKVPYYVNFPNYNTLVSLGYNEDSTATEDEYYFKGLCKWAIDNFANQGYILLIGNAQPNSIGYCCIELYSNNGKDANTGLPQYCSGTFISLSFITTNFGCRNYIWKWKGIFDGTATTSSKWETPRTITLTGSVTGSVSIDGSANVSLATTTNHTHTFASLTDKPTTLSGYGITDASRVFRYTIPASGNKGVRITFTSREPVKITVSGNNQGAQLVLVGTGYGAGGFVRNNFTEVVQGTYYTWCVSEKDACSVEIFSIRPDPDIVTVESPSPVTFAAISALSTDAAYRHLLTTANFNSYAPKLDGTGATGTWGINISGNAATATNADMLDGYHKNDILRKTHGPTSVISLNDIVVSGGIDFTSWSYAHSANVNNQPWGDGASSAACVVSFGTNFPFQIYSDYNNTSYLYYRSYYGGKGWKAWRQFAFLDSNVASASKLQNSRTIFGKSFNGTDNVTGGAKFTNICIEINNTADVDLTSEINTFDSNLYLQHHSSKNLIICMGGGNVGIGTTSPSYKLHVAGAIRASDYLSTQYIELIGSTPFIDFHYGSSTADYTSRIIEDASGQLTVIGKLRIGSDNPTSNNYTFYVASGDSFFYDNVITSSDFSSRGDAIIDGTVSCTKLVQTSDIKYKTNIKQIEYEEALKIIENLNPVTWDWNENTIVTGSSSGFVAQEAEEFIPNAISRDNENNLSLDYTQLHSYEIRVIQEQQKEIKDLKQRLEVLENLVLQLTNREI